MAFLQEKLVNMYDEFSSDYDRFVNWSNRLSAELPFLERILKSTARGDEPLHVLDAACGTGMHAIALAKKGFTVAGSDLSGAMVERARLNASDAGVSSRFETAGFGSLARTFGQASFDAVLCLGNSLPHLLSLQELTTALFDFSACLRPGGILIIQNRNFNTVLANRERWMEPQSHREGEREWVFLRFYDFGPDGLIQFNVITLTRESHGDWSQRNSGTLLYPLLEADLSMGLRQAGFGRTERFGGLGPAPFDASSSPNLVIVARKDQE